MPELVILYKCYNGSICISLILQVRRRNPNKNTFLVQRSCLTIKSLIHRAVIIKQILLCVFAGADPEEFLYTVKPVCIIRIPGTFYLIFEDKRCIILIAFLNFPVHISGYLRCKRSPKHLCLCRCKCDLLIGGTVRIGICICLQIAFNLIALTFKRRTVKIICKIQVCLIVAICRILDPGIKINILIIQVQGYFQNPLFFQDLRIPEI